MELTGVSTAVLAGGDGPPIILLHAPGESSFWWMRVIPALVTSHRVIIPDLPGHGASTVTDNALDADSVIAWLGELIDETCSHPPILIGHLLGGAIAPRFASNHGAQLQQLALVDSLGLSRFLPSPRFAFGLIRFLVRPTYRAYHSFLDQYMIDRDGLIQQMDDDWEPFLAYNLERARTPSVKTAMGTLMNEVGVPRIQAETLKRISVSTSLIWGRDDRAIRLGNAEKASARSGWPLHVIDDAGDDPKLERPDAFFDALDDVLNSSSTRELTE